ncbi:hypothetical protein Tco_1191878 [Tanacetum coccineum]
MDWYCKKQGISKLTQQDLEGPAYEIVKVFHLDVVNLLFQMEECYKLLTDQVDDAILRYNVSKPLPLGGDPGHVTIQSDFFFNKDLEYLWAVWTHMRILSVFRIEVFPMYGYNYMKKIVLRRADLMEYVIAGKDFKYLYPSDFEDLYLLNLHEDFQLGIESYQTQLNLTKPRWDAKGFEYKHDFTFIDSPRAVTFRDKYGVQMIMRFNEIHKFNDGTPGLAPVPSLEVVETTVDSLGIPSLLLVPSFKTSILAYYSYRVRDGAPLRLVFEVAGFDFGVLEVS